MGRLFFVLNTSANLAIEEDGIGNKGGKCDISLLCNTCSEAFMTPWDLMVHAQAAHSMHIYEYKNDEEENDDPRSIENVAQDMALDSSNDMINTAINTYSNEVPLHQQTEQSFLPQSQAATVGDRSH